MLCLLLRKGVGMLVSSFLQIVRQKLNLVLVLLLVFFHPGFLDADARGMGDDYPNLALDKDSYMVRLQDSLPPASNGNDGDRSTATRSTRRTIKRRFHSLIVSFKGDTDGYEIA